MEVVQENTVLAQAKQKKYYDWGTKDRTLEVGEHVLVLLPAVTNKLGVYRVLRQVTPVDYEVATPRGRKTYHVNLLKWWKLPPTPAVPNLLAVLDGKLEDKQEPGFCSWGPETEMEVDISQIQTPELTMEEREQLLFLAQEFAPVFSAVPGRTSLHGGTHHSGRG